MSVYVQCLHYMCSVLCVQPIHVLCLSKSAWKISVHEWYIVNILCKNMLKLPLLMNTSPSSETCIFLHITCYSCTQTPDPNSLNHRFHPDSICLRPLSTPPLSTPCVPIFGTNISHYTPPTCNHANHSNSWIWHSSEVIKKYMTDYGVLC